MLLEARRRSWSIESIWDMSGECNKKGKHIIDTLVTPAAGRLREANPALVCYGVLHIVGGAEACC